MIFTIFVYDVKYRHFEKWLPRWYAIRSSGSLFEFTLFLLQSLDLHKIESNSLTKHVMKLMKYPLANGFEETMGNVTPAIWQVPDRLILFRVSSAPSILKPMPVFIAFFSQQLKNNNDHCGYNHMEFYTGEIVFHQVFQFNVAYGHENYRCCKECNT